MTGPPQTNAVAREILRDLRRVQLASSDRFDRPLREPVAKRLLKLALERREQLCSSSKLGFISLRDARCKTQPDDDERPAKNGDPFRMAAYRIGDERRRSRRGCFRTVQQ